MNRHGHDRAARLLLSRETSSRRLPDAMRTGPQSAFFMDFEKTTFGIEFIDAASGPLDCGQYAAMSR